MLDSFSGAIFSRSLFMVTSMFSRTITLPEPEVSGLLPDVPGGEPNLIPETLTHDDLKVWFTVPAHSDPSTAKETVELFVDYVDETSVPLDKREWTAPIQDSDRFVLLAKMWLRNAGNEGQHRLSYRFSQAVISRLPFRGSTSRTVATETRYRSTIS